MPQLKSVLEGLCQRPVLAQRNRQKTIAALPCNEFSGLLVIDALLIEAIEEVKDRGCFEPADCASRKLSMAETVTIEFRSGRSGMRTTVHMPNIVGSRLSHSDQGRKWCAASRT